MMGRYDVFILASYGIALAVMAGLLLVSLWRWRKAQRRLKTLRAPLPPDGSAAGFARTRRHGDRGAEPSAGVTPLAGQSDMVAFAAAYIVTRPTNEDDRPAQGSGGDQNYGGTNGSSDGSFDGGDSGGGDSGGGDGGGGGGGD
jgi:heme exporter protein CcmD